jgi:adenylate kinase
MAALSSQMLFRSQWFDFMAQFAKYRTLLLFGAPGSGKGTQGSILGSIPGFVHVSCGELFRTLRVGSPLATVFLDYSSKGILVPDDFTIELWSEYVSGLVKTQRFDPQVDTLILDGIPRNAAQAELMDNVIDVLRVYYLDCSDKNVMFDRLKRRALHENRLDDASDKIIEQRLGTYEAETAPVLQHYAESIIRRIDTGRTPVEVLADILADIKQAVISHSLPEVEAQ